MQGFLIVDKSPGWTSRDAVNVAVKLCPRGTKVGHAGTLDPLATGVLPLAFGEATKTVPYLVDARKTYRFTVGWGAETTTDDTEGTFTRTSDTRPSVESIVRALPSFVGPVMQVPPAFSAIKVDGERAYDLARAGEKVEMAERPVTIEKLVLVSCLDADHAVFEVTCGKGTYVRSLARDMGRKLGCLGHVSMLRRIAVGPFSEADMIPLDKLEEMSHKPLGNSAENGVLRPLETVLDGIPALALKDAEAQRLKQGQSILLRGANAPVACDAVLVTWDSKPLGICSIEQGSLKPKRLFNL